MSNQVYAINKYQFISTDQLLLDANIWLYISGPKTNPQDWRKIVYSIALKKAAAAKSKVFIDTLIMSEFVNSYARAVYNKLP